MAYSDNKFWGGEAPLDNIAQQIAHAHGPSGSNRDYLFNLAEAIRKITSINDEHLYTLDQLVKDILTEEEQNK
jgi:cation transport regulator ChaC